MSFELRAERRPRRLFSLFVWVRDRYGLCRRIRLVSEHGTDGKAYKMSLAKLLEMRLEPEALAVKLDKPISLFL
jgi:hypothetical protein